MITRRKLLKSTAATGLTLAAGGLAAPALARDAKIRLGYVSPQSGPLAAFSDADRFIIDGFLASDAGSNFEVIVKDSQSNPNRAAEVAKELIIDDEIDMMLVASTPAAFTCGDCCSALSSSSNASPFSDSIVTRIFVFDFGSTIKCFTMCSVNSSNSFLELSDLMFASTMICVTKLPEPASRLSSFAAESSVPLLEPDAPLTCSLS